MCANAFFRPTIGRNSCFVAAHIFWFLEQKQKYPHALVAVTVCLRTAE